MAAIMSQLLPNHFPLSVADIRLVMQNAAVAAETQRARMPPTDHQLHLQQFIKANSSLTNGTDDGNDSDSDVSVGQENDEISDGNSGTPDCVSPDSSIHDTSDDRLKRASVDFTEDASNDSRFTQRTDAESPMRVPPILRPSPTRLHEEFLRNSQLYAEELMRQQLNLVAAGGAAFPKLARPFLTAPAGLPSGNPTTVAPHLGQQFRGVSHLTQNHLNAISQITQNLTNTHEIYKITSPSLSSDNSQSPPVFAPSAAAAAAAAMLMNNNLTDHNLKFGIDNILKADFGCRITDPLKRKSGKRMKQQQQQPAATSPPPISTKTPDRIPINLTREMVARTEAMDTLSQKSVSPPLASSTTTSTSSSTTSTTSSSGEKGPIVWPAWVYCTRYSDRPSSGR